MMTKQNSKIYFYVKKLISDGQEITPEKLKEKINSQEGLTENDLNILIIVGCNECNSSLMDSLWKIWSQRSNPKIFNLSSLIGIEQIWGFDEVKRWIEIGANPHSQNAIGRCPYYGFIFCGDLEKIKKWNEICTDSSVYYGGVQFPSGLFFARHVQTVEFLIAKGDDPNVLFDSKFSRRIDLERPLFAAFLKFNTAVVKALLEGGASPNVKNSMNQNIVEAYFEKGKEDTYLALNYLSKPEKSLFTLLYQYDFDDSSSGMQAAILKRYPDPEDQFFFSELRHLQRVKKDKILLERLPLSSKPKYKKNL